MDTTDPGRPRIRQFHILKEMFSNFNNVLGQSLKNNWLMEALGKIVQNLPFSMGENCLQTQIVNSSGETLTYGVEDNVNKS